MPYCPTDAAALAAACVDDWAKLFRVCNKPPSLVPSFSDFPSAAFNARGTPLRLFSVACCRSLLAAAAGAQMEKWRNGSSTEERQNVFLHASSKSDVSTFLISKM